jgi:cytochrome c biogenesis protein CcmG, thiol:disulfide interchange protein DsbE
MDAPVTTTGESGAATPRTSRVRNLAIMAITAVLIAALAFVVNQPKASAGGITDVTLSGVAAGDAPTVGKPAPDFGATTVDGRAVKLSDFKGQPVWLTFGASWCQPCRAENPDIKAVYEKAKAGGLEVLAIFISEDAAAVKDYADRVGLGYDKVADPDTAIASQYRILGIPSHFFIDSDGVLQQMKIGSLDQAAMEQAIESITR